MNGKRAPAGMMGLLGVLVAGCSVLFPPQPIAQPTQAGMGAMVVGGEGSADYAPLVKGFYEGGELLFIHTEASDPSVAEMLTMMMGPRVVLVPELGDVPATALADVYVFTNGVAGDGPFGFQSDVFDTVPGDAEYRPLRRVNLVHWTDGADPRELRSVGDIRAAEAEGKVSIQTPGIVVNMPILVWPGGHR
jgi:hypothetical protein